jgi:GNAT superfamily N-acetyltransferase
MPEDTDSGRVVGTVSVLFDCGAHSDLVGEFGRLAVHPDYRRMQVGKLLMDKRLDAIKNCLHVGLVVARAVHPYAQRISLGRDSLPPAFRRSSTSFAPLRSLDPSTRGKLAEKCRFSPPNPTLPRQ